MASLSPWAFSNHFPMILFLHNQPSSAVCVSSPSNIMIPPYYFLGVSSSCLVPSSASPILMASTTTSSSLQLRFPKILPHTRHKANTEVPLTHVLQTHSQPQSGRWSSFWCIIRRSTPVLMLCHNAYIIHLIWSHPVGMLSSHIITTVSTVQ